MKANIRLLLTAVGAVASSHATATGADNAPDIVEDRAAILAVLDKAFAAVASQDPDDWRPLLLDEARSLSFRINPDRPQDAPVMRERSFGDFISGMKPGEGGYFERWLGEPDVLIRGSIAAVWGKYDFWIDGAFSHCGVDSVNLAKVDGEWKIAHFMWTVETDGCASAGDAFPGGDDGR